MKKFLCFCFTLIVSTNLSLVHCNADTISLYSTKNNHNSDEIYKNKCLDEINSIRSSFSLPGFSIDDNLSSMAGNYLDTFDDSTKNHKSVANDSNLKFCIYKQKLSIQNNLDYNFMVYTIYRDYKRYLINPNISNIGIYVENNNQTISFAFAFKYN